MGFSAQTAFSVTSGAALGIVCSWLCNCALLEVSLNPFFSFYFGLLFILIGGVILCRLHSQDRVERKPLIQAFAGMVVVAGMLCFLLDQHIVRMSYIARIPMYSVLGVAVAFAFSFSIVDIANGLVGMCGPDRLRFGRAGIVDSPAQVTLVLVASSIMGALFGLSFGLMDLEDRHGMDLRNKLYEDEMYFCYPVGLLIGGVAGYMNERLREAPPGGYLGHSFMDDM